MRDGEEGRSPGEQAEPLGGGSKSGRWRSMCPPKRERGRRESRGGWAGRDDISEVVVGRPPQAWGWWRMLMAASPSPWLGVVWQPVGPLGRWDPPQQCWPGRQGQQETAEGPTGDEGLPTDQMEFGEVTPTEQGVGGEEAGDGSRWMRECP